MTNDFYYWLQKMDQIEKNATPRPWKYDGGNWEIEGPENRKGIALLGHYNTGENPIDQCYGNWEDGLFIEAARSWIPEAIIILKSYRDALEFYSYEGNAQLDMPYEIHDEGYKPFGLKAKEALALQPNEMKE